MGDTNEWGRIGQDRDTISEDRRVYVEHLRCVHTDYAFRLALLDEVTAASADVERVLFEAEMLANYYVV